MCPIQHQQKQQQVVVIGQCAKSKQHHYYFPIYCPFLSDLHLFYISQLFSKQEKNNNCYCLMSDSAALCLCWSCLDRDSDKWSPSLRLETIRYEYHTMYVIIIQLFNLFGNIVYRQIAKFLTFDYSHPLYYSH